MTNEAISKGDSLSRNEAEYPVPTAISPLQRWFPIAVWIKTYDWRKNGITDVIAAITVSAILIPESFGYASIAGVPSQISLYAVILGLIGYAFFGGSRLLVVGATGSVAAVIASVVGQLAAGNQEKAVLFAVGLAFTSALVLLLTGLLKLGWIANFISRSVMMGVIVGMSIQIIFGQLPKLAGIKVPDGTAFSKLWNTFASIGSWNWTEFSVGVGGILIILLLERFMPKLPAALVVVVFSSMLVGLAGLHLTVTPKIPSGLPTVSFPVGITMSEWITLLIGGVMVSLVCFSESWGASAAISKKTHDELIINQEFRAYGVANLGSAILGGMPISGSLSKSATAMDAGATSQMLNIFLAGIVVLVLLFLSPAFQWLPETALAAIVIMAIRSPANPIQFAKLWHLERLHTAIGILTAIMVLTVDLMPAIIFGVVVSIINLIYKITFPSGVLLGKVENGEIFRPISSDFGNKTFKSEFDAHPIKDIIIYRFSAPLIFSNAQTFLNRMKGYLIKAAENKERTRAVIIDCEAMLYLDITGLDAMIEFQRYCEEYGITLYLARMHETAFKMILSAKELENLSQNRSFPTIRETLAAAQKNM